MKRNKISLTVMVLLLLVSSALTAGGTQEKLTPEAEDTAPQDDMNVVIAALKGPSGFAAAKMLKDDFQPEGNVTIEYILLGSPLEAVAKMTSGEIDAAFLPVNVAAKLYTKGLGFRLAAVSGLGSLYLLSTDSSVSDWQSLKGKTIHLTGKGATPDYLLRYLLQKNGIDPAADVTLNFTAAPPQIIQLIAAGKADTAFIPQPFALMAETNTTAEILLDPQKELMKLRGTERAFPFTAFVLSEKIISQAPNAAEEITAALKDSIDWVLANPIEAAVEIEHLGIMSAAIAESAIPVSGVEFLSAAESEEEVLDFLQMLLELDPVSIGGDLPDEGFFIRY